MPSRIHAALFGWLRAGGPHALRQGLALEELQDEKRLALLGDARVVDADDVGVVELRQHGGLAQEALLLTDAP